MVIRGLTATTTFGFDHNVIEESTPHANRRGANKEGGYCKTYGGAKYLGRKLSV
jgi:hypothetical protein